MRRKVCWSETLDDGTEREIRVSFPGGGQIKWQFWRSDTGVWDYDTPPTPADWDTLEAKVNVLYRRRGAPYRDLELVRKRRTT